MVNQIPQPPKIDQILELFKSLSPDEKGQFIDKITEDEELMARLLDVLLQKNQAEEEAASQPDYTSTDSYVDFLRKVKE